MKTPLKDKKATEAEVENAQEAAFAKAAAELLPKLREYFGAQRWERLKRQMQARSQTEEALALILVKHRGSLHTDNEAAWVIKAAHLLLLRCGSVIKPEDQQKLDSLLHPGDTKPPVVETPPV